MKLNWSRVRPFENDNVTLRSLLYADNDFNKICLSYGKDVNTNYHNFLKANNSLKNAGSNRFKKRKNKYLDHSLFNPINFYTFGHADELGIVLLDDFHPVYHIPAQIRTIVEDVCLAFCPSLSSLKLSDINFDKWNLKKLTLDSEKAEIYKFLNVFSELHTFDLKIPPISIRQKNKFDDYALNDHPFQKQTPLLAFTKYKINTLAILGHGLLSQHALYRAIAAKIMMTLALLGKYIKPKNNSTSDNNFNLFINPSQIQNIKIVFLDLQGTEEIGTLIFCENYSIAISLVAAINSLTFDDILKVDYQAHLEKVMDRTLADQLNFRIDQEVHDTKISLNNARLEKNHVIRWAHTSLAIAPQAFFNPEVSKCNGLVEGISEVQVSSGHLNKVIKNIDENLSLYQEKAPSQKKDKQKKHIRYHIGVTDYIFQNLSEYRAQNSDLDKNKVSSSFISICELLNVIKRNLEFFGYRYKKFDYGRDIINWKTDIVVPIPNIGFNNPYIESFLFGSEKHYSLIAESLAIIQRRLCYHTKNKKYLESEEKYTLGDKLGRLDIDKINEATRKCGIPETLRRTIEYIYKNFATLFADPFMFDVVLDLYDTLLALHQLLTEHLPEKLNKESDRLGDSEYLLFLDENRIDQLGMLIEAIHDALIHRIQRTYPDIETRSMAIDFRGGLNQLLNIADSVSKAGLGVLKRYFAFEKSGKLQRERVGGLIKIGLTPGAKTFSLNFGVEEKVELAYFELDVPHVFHPASVTSS